MVMLFHYSYLFNGEFYDIGVPVKSFFKYGYLGVQLFFIISGFVITLTLTKSPSFLVFLKKRWIRLFPGMLICSVLTFVLITIFDTGNLFPDSKKTVNLLISNTFISPSVINPIFNVKTSYIDAPYWSLWVEIQFYILIGVIFFLNRKFFIRNFILSSIFLSGLFFISHNTNILPEKTNWFLRVFLEIFNFSEHALWFVLGVLVYQLYYFSKSCRLLLVFCIILLQLCFSKFEIPIILFMVICILVFYSFIYNQKLLRVLENSLFQKLGIVSYSIYLIHQNLGLLIINKFSPRLGKLNFLLPFLNIMLFCFIGIILYKHFEKPFGKYLKNKLKI